VTQPSGEAESRLSAALEEIFGGRTTADTERRGDDDTSVARDGAADLHHDGDDHDHDDDAADPDGFELPEIVPATVEPPAPELPPQAASAAQAAPAAPTIVPTATPVAPPQVPAAAVSPPTVSAAWGDLVPPSAARPTAQLRAPGRRPRVRRVTRVVRHVDPWSVFKVALIFSVVAYLAVLTSGVLLWRVADSTGTIDNVERWFTQFGWETFELRGGEIFDNAWVIGLFLAVGLTGTAVLMATLFNLVSDIVGGVRVTVLEEEVVERTASSARRYVVRRPPLAGPTQPVDGWEVDDDRPVTPPEAVTEPSPIPNATSAATRRATAGTTDWSVDD
jgi:hypothetical protein